MTDEQVKAVFRQRVTDAMQSLGYEVPYLPSALGRLLDINRKTTTTWLNGRSFPTPSQLVQLSKVLGRSVDWLLGLDDVDANQQMTDVGFRDFGVKGSYLEVEYPSGYVTEQAKVFGLNSEELDFLQLHEASLTGLYEKGDVAVIERFDSTRPDRQLIEDGGIYLVRNGTGCSLRRIEVLAPNGHYRLHADQAAAGFVDHSPTDVGFEESSPAKAKLLGRVRSFIRKY